MSFPYSYSVLGLVPGLIITVVVAAIVLYTSLVIWLVSRRKFDLNHVNNMQGILSSSS